MISLRLTEGEYDALHTLFASYGARSISDFARFALQTVISETSHLGREPLSSSLQDLSERVNALEVQLGLLLEKQNVTR